MEGAGVGVGKGEMEADLGPVVEAGGAGGVEASGLCRVWTAVVEELHW